MPAPVIKLEHVSCAFPHRSRKGRIFWALKDISFTVDAGERVAVIGRNGAGKSTLLQLLAGIIDPSEGRIEQTTDRITLLSLNAGMQPTLSGQDNAIMTGILLGMPYREMRRRIDSIREFAELGDFFEMPVATYSSGMRARLGFATALHIDTKVLLIDEVLAVGDQEFRKKAREALQTKMRSNGTAVILVSHNPAVVKGLCPRTVWIEQGKLRAAGETEPVIERYQQEIRHLRGKPNDPQRQPEI